MFTFARLDTHIGHRSPERSHRSFGKNAAKRAARKSARKNSRPFGIDHLTIQIETSEGEQNNLHPCFSGANCFESAPKIDFPKGK